MTFNESNVVLRFPVLSDLHIVGKARETSQKLNDAYRQLCALGQADVLMFAGDMTDYGRQEQVEEFRNITCSYWDLNTTKLLYCLGNHELYDYELDGNSLDVGERLAAAFQEHASEETSAEDIHNGRRHITVKGFHFLAVSAIRYLGGVVYRDEDLQWLQEQLEIAVADAPEKPLFICSHAMIKKTCYGSNYGSYWAGDQLFALLKKYPQAVYFAGHLHFPLQHEDSIWQGDFTAIGTSSLYYVSLENKTEDGIRYIDVSGSETGDCHKFSQGLYVQVDANNNVSIRRCDFYRNTEIQQPWILVAPSFRLHKSLRPSTLPVFPKNSIIETDASAVQEILPTFRLRFTAAQDESMILMYRIRFLDKEGITIKETAVYSDFYLAATTADMAPLLEKVIPPSQLAPFTPVGEGDYRVEIVAVTQDGRQSLPLCSKMFQRMHSKAPIEMKQLLAARKIQLLNCHSMAQGYVLEKNRDYFGWPEQAKGGCMPPIVEEGLHGRVIAVFLNSTRYQCYEFMFGKETPVNASAASWLRLWVDFTQIKFSKLAITLRDEDIQYTTDDKNGCDMNVWIMDMQGMRTVPFNNDGCLMNFGGFCGYMYLPLAYFYNLEQNLTPKCCKFNSIGMQFTLSEGETELHPVFQIGTAEALIL